MISLESLQKMLEVRQMSINYNLETAERLIKEARQELKDVPERAALVELINACETLDKHYKKYCEKIDFVNADEPGTAYKDGFSMEYYIEGDWWQQISEALRVLRKDI